MNKTFSSRWHAVGRAPNASIHWLATWCVVSLLAIPSISLSQRTAVEAFEVCEISGDGDYVQLGDRITLRQLEDDSIVLEHASADPSTGSWRGADDGAIVLKPVVLSSEVFTGERSAVMPGATFDAVVRGRHAPLRFNLVRRPRPVPNEACRTEAGHEEVLIIRVDRPTQATYLSPR